MAHYTTYIEGCERCQMFANHEESLSGARPEMTPGYGTDCNRHACSKCGRAAPEEGHTCEPRDGLPVCTRCEAEGT